jgi:hypothetical protein
MIIKFDQFCKEINEALSGLLEPSSLERVKDSRGSTVHKLNREAAAAYELMRKAAEEDGISWKITDSYRSYEQQVEVASKKGIYGRGGLAAKPGTSNHGWGSAIDLNLGETASDKEETLGWLKINAEKFGFTSIAGEPWHWEHKASSQAAKSSTSLAGTPTKVLIDADFIKRLIAKLQEKNFSEDDLIKFSSSAKSKAAVTLSSTEDEEFYIAVLKSLGTNPTPEKIKFLKAWRQAEGGRATNNPFNTTKNIPGDADTNYNSIGVKNYPSRQAGLDATVATLKLKYYKDLLSRLMDDSSTAEEIAASPDLKTWGTGAGVTNVLAGRTISPPPIA